MKFGSLLRNSSSELPEITCLFDTYKQLKKQLKRLPDRSQLSAAEVNAAQQQALTQDEAHFVATIDRSLADLNNMFMEKEEEAVIRLEALQRASRSAVTDENRRALYRRLVDFHGELLLLVHWSVLAYTATVKILKKHHKRTGLLLRAPQLGNLLSQPFCSTELMTRMAHKAEESILELAHALATHAPSDSVHTVSAPAPSTAHGQAAVSGPPSPTSLGPQAQEGNQQNGQHHRHHQHHRQHQDPPNSSLSVQTDAPTETELHATLSEARLAERDPIAQAGGGNDAIGRAAAGIHRVSDSTTNGSSALVDSDTDVSGDGLEALQGLEAVHKAVQDNHKRLCKESVAGGESGQGSWPPTAQGSMCTASEDNGSGVGGVAAGHHARRTGTAAMDLLRRTQVALDTWSQLRATASTPSTVLPASAIAPKPLPTDASMAPSGTSGPPSGTTAPHVGVKRSRESLEEGGAEVQQA